MLFVGFEDITKARQKPNSTVMYVAVGGNLTLRCCNSTQEFEWRRNDRVDLIYTAGKIRAPFVEKFSASVADGCQLLTLLNASHDDSGQYVCFNGHGDLAADYAVDVKGNTYYPLFTFYTFTCISKQK